MLQVKEKGSKIKLKQKTSLYESKFTKRKNILQKPIFIIDCQKFDSNKTKMKLLRHRQIPLPNTHYITLIKKKYKLTEKTALKKLTIVTHSR